jgi:PAS domain S-box-containing protein
MKNSTPIQEDNHPYLVASLGRVTHVSGSFAALTGYPGEEVTGAFVEDIFSLLRLTQGAWERLAASGRAECWLFTKALEPREVIVTRQTGAPHADGSNDTYTFFEKPHSRLEEVLAYPCQLLEEDIIGVSIYSAPDFTLLRANQTYLDFCDDPYRCPERTFGRTIGEFVDGYEGSAAEEAVRRIFATGKSEVLRELRFEHFKRGVTYWDQLITPVKTNGEIKYIVTNTQDVTERVLARQQYAWLAAVYENMPFPLVALDKDGTDTNANRAARELFSPPPGTQEGMRRDTQFYDADDRPIDPNDTPCHKVRQGERAADFMMAVKKGRDTSYVNVSGTPIYNTDGEFIAGLISYRDVTEQARYTKHHKSLIDAMQSGVTQYDGNGTVISMNPAAVKILGLDPGQAFSSSIGEQRQTIRPDGSIFPSEEYPVYRTLRTGLPVQDVIMGVFNPILAEYRWINVNAVPLFHPGDRSPYQVFTVFDDITEQKKAEDALKKSEAALRSVLDHAGDFIYSLNTQTYTYEYVSPLAEKVLGCSVETFMKTDVRAFHESVHPDDRPVFYAALQALDDKSETEIRFRQRVKNGDYRWFSNHLTDVKDADGRILYRNGRIRDITEQVKSDEVIRYQAGLLQSISDIIISSDENNIIRTWNKAAELTYGWTAEEAIGQSLETLLKTQVIGTTLEKAYDDLLRYGKVEIETIDTCKDGRRINISCTPKLLKDATGRITGIVGIFHDITEKKKMEGALREKETHLRLAAEAAKLGTYAFDLENGTIFISEELKTLWGVLPEAQAELDEMFFFVGLHPDDKQPFLEKILAANDPNGDGLIENDYRILTPDGAVKWLHTRGQTTFGDIGGQRVPVYAAGVAIDITERVAAENSIREMSEELQNIIDSTDDYIYSVNREFRLVNFNSSFSAYAEQKLGKRIEKGILMPSVLTRFDTSFWELFFQRVAREGKIQLEISVEEGRILSIAFNPVYIDGQLTEITVFARDITERVAVENSVRELSEELQNIIDSTNDYIYSIDRDFRLVYYNSAFGVDVHRIFGIQIEKGMRVPDIMPKLDDAYWEDAFSRVAGEGKFYLESRIDHGTRVMQFSFNPVYKDGQVAEMTVFGKDITERLSSEREIIRLNASLEKRVQERTEELQKSVGDLKNLSRIVSHDLKEPVRQIACYAEHIQALTDKGDIRSEASDIRKTCGRMTRLIEGLSEYAMSSELKIRKEAVHVRKMVTAIFNELKTSAPNNTLLQFESGLPVVCADKLLLKHVLLNLLSNVLKFSSKRETSEITVGCREENFQYIFYIRDNGVGFDMQYAHKLFKVFERLHADEGYEGTGIGLAAVHNIIRRHGGATWIESRENTGTTVYFTLPAADKGPVLPS